MRRLIPALWIFLSSAAAAMAGGQPQASLGAAAASFTLCTGPCAVVDVNAMANAASFVFIFDATVLPGNGTVGASAKAAFPVASSGETTYTYGPAEPGIFLSGVVLGCSSTAPPTFTSATTCFFFGRAN